MEPSPMPKQPSPDSASTTPKQEALARLADESGALSADQTQIQAEEARVSQERQAVGGTDAATQEQYRNSLKLRAMQEIEAEHGYVHGGPEAIEAKMAEIQARDRSAVEATTETGQMTAERVPHRYENQEDQSPEASDSETKVS